MKRQSDGIVWPSARSGQALHGVLRALISLMNGQTVGVYAPTKKQGERMIADIAFQAKVSGVDWRKYKDKIWTVNEEQR